MLLPSLRCVWWEKSRDESGGVNQTRIRLTLFGELEGEGPTDCEEPDGFLGVAS